MTQTNFLKTSINLIIIKVKMILVMLLKVIYSMMIQIKKLVNKNQNSQLNRMT